MTVQTTPARSTTAPSTTLRVLYRLLLRVMITRGRLIALSGVGLVGILLGVAIRGAGTDIDHARAAYNMLDAFSLGMLAPVVSLVFATAALGDVAEDSTLVYLWLKPIPRWQLTVAALGASLTIALPLIVLPTVVAAAMTGTGTAIVAGALWSSVLASVAYAAIFVGLGLKVRRALIWGLAYVLIWEGAVARTGRGASRLAIHVYARSILARVAGQPLPKISFSAVPSVLVPAIVALVALVLTTRLLRRADVA